MIVRGDMFDSSTCAIVVQFDFTTIKLVPMCSILGFYVTALSN